MSENALAYYRTYMAESIGATALSSLLQKAMRNGSAG